MGVTRRSYCIYRAAGNTETITGTIGSEGAPASWNALNESIERQMLPNAESRPDVVKLRADSDELVHLGPRRRTTHFSRPRTNSS